MTEEIKTFGELQVGDYVLGSGGTPTKVTEVYPSFHSTEMYRLEFEGGKVINASGNHLWYIETDISRSMHRGRVKQARRLLKDMVDPEKEQELLSLAELPVPAEVSLVDMIAIMGAYEADREEILVRIAESIGHIAEENTEHRDLLTDEVAFSSTMRIYDARQFAQQLLGLFDKKYEKRWSIVVGQVVTTETLVHLDVEVNIPEIKETRQSFFRRQRN